MILIAELKWQTCDQIWGSSYVTRLLDIQLGMLKAMSLKLCEVTFAIARICNTTTQPYMGCGEW